ncbi:MAG: PaaI family thioesterase [bacterium]|nr:PaaI family thioesterase [bacterium]
MNAYDMIRSIVPEDLFEFKDTASDLEQAQHLLSQCHPGATAMELRSLEGEKAEADIPYAQSNRALHGFMHGGCYFTVGDTMTALMCMYHVEKETERMLTINASIRYLRPIREDTVRAVARLTSKAGKRLNFVCDFYNAANKRAAQAKYQYVLAEPAG